LPIAGHWFNFAGSNFITHSLFVFLIVFSIAVKTSKLKTYFMRLILRSMTFLFAASLILTSCKKDDTITDFVNPPIADAGPSQVLNSSTTTLSGSGSSDNGSITGYLWTLISGPNVPDITNGSSANASLANLAVGSYIYQLTVTDSIGETGSDTMMIYVLNVSLPCVTVQPHNNPMEFHFWGNDTLNQSGHALQIEAGTWTYGGAEMRVHGAVQFDLTGIPATANIVSARLSLYSIPDPQDGDLINANAGNDNSFLIQRIATNWDPATATWLNQPSTTTDDQVLMPHTDQPFLDLTDIDVTNLVNAMHTTNNYGFMIRLQNEAYYNTRQFCSSVHGDATKHPKLVVVYQ
jgi:hypothetical protein